MALLLPPPPPTLPTPSRVAPISTTTQQSTPTLSIMAGPGSSQLTMTLQQLQALLAAQLTSGKPQLMPLPLPPQPIQPTPTPAPPPAAPPIPTPSLVLPSDSTEKPLFSCMWDNCRETFKNSVNLVNHALRLDPGSHISREVTGEYFCRWANCPRHKDLNGRPFDAQQKITRHVKEVHLMRVVPRQLLAEQGRLDACPRPSMAQDQPVIPTPVPAGNGTVLFPQTPAVKLLNPLQLAPQTMPITNLTGLSVSLATSMVTPPVQPLGVTATPIQSLSLLQAIPTHPLAATAITSAALSTAPVTSSLPIEGQARVEPRAVPQPTLREKKSVVHSSIYMK